VFGNSCHYNCYSISSLSAHNSKGAVNWPVWKRMTPGLIIGSLIGAGVVC
jgi:uncharacterized membrane protein YfcA